MATLKESKKKIGQYGDGEHVTKVYHYTGQDDDGDPYHVKHFVDGKERTESEYFTNDEDDAHSTAKDMIRRAVGVVENTELAELKKETLASYIGAASRENQRSTYALGGGRVNMRTGKDGTGKTGYEPMAKRVQRRNKSIDTAANKLTKYSYGVEPPKIKEEAELQELNKSTLGTYIKKATDDAINKTVDYANAKSSGDEVDRFTNRHMDDQFKNRDKIKGMLGADWKSLDAKRRKIGKRVSGIQLASDKLVDKKVNEENSMVNENIVTMLDRAVEGDRESAAELFQSIIGEKINARLEDMKVDVAATMFGVAQEKTEE